MCKNSKIYEKFAYKINNIYDIFKTYMIKHITKCLLVFN